MTAPLCWVRRRCWWQLELHHRSAGRRQPQLDRQGHRHGRQHHHYDGSEGDRGHHAAERDDQPTIGTDTGSTTTILSGGLTRDNTLALSGTVSDANGVSSVQVYDGATLLGTATVSAGTWSFTTAALADGSHSFTAKATDNAGNTTTTGGGDGNRGHHGAERDDQHDDRHQHRLDHDNLDGGLTKDNTLALSGTVDDANGVSSVQVYDGATLLGTATIVGAATGTSPPRRWPTAATA